MVSFLILSFLVQPLTDLRNLIFDASNCLNSLFFVVQHSAPCNSVGSAITLSNFKWISFLVLAFNVLVIVSNIRW